MANCTANGIGFSVLKRRVLEGNVGGGEISGDGGLVLLQSVLRSKCAVTGIIEITHAFLRLR